MATLDSIPNTVPLTHSFHWPLVTHPLVTRIVIVLLVMVAIIRWRGPACMLFMVQMLGTSALAALLVMTQLLLLNVSRFIVSVAVGRWFMSINMLL